MPTVEISSEDLKAISAITGMLGDKPEVLKKVAKKLEELSNEYEQKVKAEVSNILAENVKIDASKIGQLQPYWANIWRPWWHTPWYQTWWLPPWYVWGPYVDPRQVTTGPGMQ